jgi:type III secretion protein L
VVGYYRLNELEFKLAAGAHIVPRPEFAAVEEANRLLSQAEATCAQILQRAEEAYQNEMRRGYEDGLVEARIQSVGQLLNENRELDQGLLEIQRDLARLVVDCVRKLVDGFDDVTRAEALVKAAMRQMRRENVAELRVPSSLHRHFRERIGAILSEFPEVQLVDVVEDSTLEPPRIILETSIGRVDGNLARRLDDLETVIRSAHARDAADALDALTTAADAAAGMES